MIRAQFARQEHLLPDDEANRRMIVAGIHEQLSDIPEKATIAPEWLLCNAVRGLLSLEEYGVRSIADIEADGILRAIEKAEPAALAKIHELVPALRIAEGFSHVRAMVALHAARQPQSGREALDLIDRVKIFANELHIVSLRKLMERRQQKALASGAPPPAPPAKSKTRPKAQAQTPDQLAPEGYELDLLPPDHPWTMS